MLARLGIGARLFLAFLAIATLSLSSGVVGWLILRQISSAQTRINTDALPAIAAAQRTAETSVRLAAASPSLAAIDTEPQRVTVERDLRLLADELRTLTADVRRSSGDAAATAELAQIVDTLTANLSRQSALVKERLELARNFDARAERTIGAATAVVDLSETLVSNASSGTSAVVANLYGLIDDPARHEIAYEALDRLIEEDFYLLGRMFELRLRSSQIGLLANRLTRTTTIEEGGAIAREYQQHLAIVARRIRSIDDPVRREQALAHLGVLQQAGGDSPFAPSLFSQRARLISIGEMLDALGRADALLSARLNRIVQDMLQRAQSFALATADQAERAVSAGLYALVATSLAAILLSGLIVWLYVERNLVQRLVSLTSAMRRLADGELDVSVKEDGSDELKGLARAVRVFRDESWRRRALEREKERTTEELRRHREELTQLVAEQTEQLTLTNRRLQEEVASHAEARERAESASRAKSEFLAAMSHEIRTPMTGMLGMVRVLMGSELDPEQRRHLDMVASSGEALLGILNSVLDYSKIDLGKITAVPSDFDLQLLLDGVVALMETTAREKGLKLDLEVAPDLHRTVRTDAGKLRQIVFNLVSNGVKFTEHGGVVVRARLAGGNGADRQVRIEVEDTGIGIPAEHRERIFEAFTQLDASITRRFGGTGLGLAISRRLAEALGGRLALRSEQGRGSCFILECPIELADGTAQTEAPVRLIRAGGTPLDVLVVEDDELTQVVVRAFLTQSGLEPRIAVSGFDALEQARQRWPDLVLMDLSLPGMDGIETMRRLREQGGSRELPVVAMSAHVFPSDVERTLEAGMSAFVGKPIDPKRLEAAIAIALEPSSNRARFSDMVHADADSLKADIAMLGVDSVKDLLALAEKKITERLIAIEAACDTGRRRDIGQIAHAVASAAGSAGFVALNAEARAIELGAATEPIDVLLSRTATCEELLSKALRAARETLPTPDQDAGMMVAANR